MVIQHNLQAMNANRQLGIVTGNQSKSTEKLSSGYRINRAGDDAAGLAISEKMRNQITGLNMASRNAEDGISLVQTAEGALTETHSILKRMRELAVQSANDTNTAEDREQLQKEINQLTSEVNRIGNTTEFNTKKLLNGSLSDEGVKRTGYTINGSGDTLKAASIGVETTGNLGVYLRETSTTADADRGKINFSTSSLKTGTEVSFSITKTSTGLDVTFSGINSDEQEISYTQSITADKSGNYEFKDIYGTKFAIKKEDFAKIDEGSSVNYKSVVSTNPSAIYTNSQISSTYTGDVTVTLGGDMNDGSHALKDISFSIDTDKNITVNMLFADGTSVIDKQKYNGSSYKYNIDHDDNVTLTFANANAGEGALSGSIDLSIDSSGNISASKVNVATGDTLGLQVGANEGQTMDLLVGDMRAEALGLVGAGKNYTSAATVSTGLSSDNTQHALNITTMERATNAITAIDNAINKVSAQRATLGAVQNRLEHTIANLDTSSENLQAAESRIRDVDMAEEMMNYTKNNILQQASQSMLAQANQSTQGVLSLLS